MARDTKSPKKFLYTYDRSMNAYLLIDESYTGKSALGGNSPLYYQCDNNIGVLVNEKSLIEANGTGSDQKGYTCSL